MVQLSLQRKNFRVHELRVDLSPVSIKALLNWYHPYGLMAINARYPIRRFSTLCRIGGAGYRVLSRLDLCRSLRFERVRAMDTKMRLPKQAMVVRSWSSLKSLNT